MRGFYFARLIKDGKPVMTNELDAVIAYPEAQIPEYQTTRSAGADFFCAEEVTIPSIWVGVAKVVKSAVVQGTVNGNMIENSLKPTLVHTGIKASMYDDEVLELYNRSSNPKKLGLILANSVGVVDADYFDNPDNDGEIMFAFYNFKPWSVTLKVGDRVGQGVFKKFLRPEENCRVKVVQRKSGFGSTDE